MSRHSLSSRRRRIAWSAVLTTAAASLAGCGNPAETPTLTAPPVMVVGVELRDVVDRIEATGQLLATAQASIAAQVDGQITRIHVAEGAAVEAGEVLLEIDPERRQLQQSNQRALVAEAEAQLADRRREAKRVESLRAKGVASQSSVEEAHTQLELAHSRREGARARLGLAERALADSSVAAPFSGRIARRYVSVGEFVSTGQVLFDLVDLADMEVEFHLAERDSSRVEVGDAVRIRVAPFPDEVFDASVSVISPTIDSQTRTLRVKAVVDNCESRLRPGLFARVDLGLAERGGVVMVPEDAIVLRSDGSVIFRLVNGNQVERVSVLTGVHRDGWVEVARGLALDDVIVVRGQARLVDGSVVEVRTADGREPTSFHNDSHAAQVAR